MIYLITNKEVILNSRLRFNIEAHYYCMMILPGKLATQQIYTQKRSVHKRQASSIDSNTDHKKPREDNYSPAPENSNYRTDEEILDGNKHSQQILDKLNDPNKANPTYEELKDANRNLNADERLALNSLLDSRGYPETAEQ